MFIDIRDMDHVTGPVETNALIGIPVAAGSCLAANSPLPPTNFHRRSALQARTPTIKSSNGVLSRGLFERPKHMTKKPNECIEMFDAKGAADIYSAIVSKLQARVGPKLAVEDPKQTCVHFVAGKDGTAYAGVHPRKGAVLLNIRLQAPLNSKRVRNVEQVSRNRCHCEILLESISDVNEEVIGWLEGAVNLVTDAKQKTAASARKH
jgi:hypothetical protein